MTEYVFTFLLTTLIMSLLILGVAALGELFPKIFSARLRYGAWIIILIGLIIPVRPMIGSGIINIEVQAETMLQQNISPQGAFSQGTTNVLPDFTPIMIIVLIWLAGAVGVLAYHIWRYARFIRLAKRWSAAVEDKTTLSVFKSVQHEKGLANKQIRLRRCSFVSTSMLIGFFRPTVLLPEKHFETDELEMIIRHELVHYKRRDLFAKLAMVLAASVYWFNPAVYLMSAAMQADCEASCDEIVLTEVGRQNNQFYAELIIEMISDKKMVGTALSTCFYGSKRSVKKRMAAIMDQAERIRKLSFAVLCTITALIVMSGSVFAFSELQIEEMPTLTPVLYPIEEAPDENEGMEPQDEEEASAENEDIEPQDEEEAADENEGIKPQDEEEAPAYVPQITPAPHNNRGHNQRHGHGQQNQGRGSNCSQQP